MTPSDLVRKYIDAYNAGNVDAMLACVTDDVVFENISNTGQDICLTGKDHMRQVAELSRNAFSDRHQAVERILEGPNGAAAEIRFSGTPTVQLPNGAKPGVPLEIRGASFFEIRDGLFSRIADYS